MDFSQRFEKQIVSRHRIKHSWRRENHAVGRTENRNQNGERHKLACPGTQDSARRGCRNRIAAGSDLRPQRHQIANHCQNVSNDSVVATVVIRFDEELMAAAQIDGMRAEISSKRKATS